PHVRLLDPYARALDGPEDWDAGLFAYDLGNEDLVANIHDAIGAPLGCVIDPRFDWGDDKSPNTPFHRTVIYETHVRGLTMRHPGVPPNMRGKFAGVAHPAMIEHFRSLGRTAIELLPVHRLAGDK